jgi:transforming growth factor-beta-induced protein
MKRNHYKLTQRIATAALCFGFMASTTSIKAQTVFDVIANSLNHTILEAALVQEGLDVDLKTTGPFTVFAPDDAAFNQYLSDNNLTSAQLLASPELKNILLHHVISGNISSTNLTAGEVVTLNGADVTVNLTGGVFIDDAEVTTPDLTDMNGVVHVINGILIPTFDDVTEVVSRSPNHTILLQALVKANLVSTLQGTGPYTVFAPDDSAFIRFFDDNGLTANDLLNNPELTNILLHHVIGAKVESKDLTNDEVTTLNGADVTVDITNGVLIDDATVTTADIMAGNGVVHVINGILIPGYDDVTEVVIRSSNHTILLQALVKANLVTTLQGTGPFTVFAPDDSAFIRFLAANMLTAQDLLDDADLSKILLNHVVGSYLNASDLVAGPLTTLNNTDVSVVLTGGVKVGNASVTAADIDTDNGVVHVINDILVPGTAARKTIKNNGISIFPNPTNGTIYITNNAVGQYEILSLQGQIVQKGTLTQSSLSVDALPAGNYILKVSGSNGVSTAQFNKL